MIETTITIVTDEEPTMKEKETMARAAADACDQEPRHLAVSSISTAAINLREYLSAKYY